MSADNWELKYLNQYVKYNYRFKFHSDLKMQLKDCHNFNDFRALARKRIPGPIFNYIDGAADDEKTYDRNTKEF